jgi:hypothetical protein
MSFVVPQLSWDDVRYVGKRRPPCPGRSSMPSARWTFSGACDLIACQKVEHFPPKSRVARCHCDSVHYHTSALDLPRRSRVHLTGVAQCASAQAHHARSVCQQGGNSQHRVAAHRGSFYAIFQVRAVVGKQKGLPRARGVDGSPDVSSSLSDRSLLNTEKPRAFECFRDTALQLKHIGFWADVRRAC